MPIKNQILKIKIAYLISRFFDPIFLLLPLSLIIFYSDKLNGYHRFFWAAALLFFMFFLPLLSFIVMYKKKIVNSIELAVKEERTPFIIAVIFCWFIALAFVMILSGPRFVISLLISAIIIGILLLIINLYSKFSGHTLVITISVFLINFLHNWQYPWLFLFIPLVAWSRYVQRYHTLFELFGGTALGCFFYSLLNILTN